MIFTSDKGVLMFVCWVVGVPLGLDPLQKLQTDFREILEDADIGKEQVA